jgi:hypothetical protein
MSNQFDATVLKRFVGEIEKHHDQIASYKGEHAQRVKSVQEMISDVYDRAKDSGVPKRELKAVIKERALLKKIEALREDMEEEQAETYDQIKHSLGMLSDLPLGEVALKRSKAIDSLNDEDGDDETEEQGDEPDADEIAASANTKALTGIRPLN